MRGAIDRPREAALASRQPPPRQGVPHGVEEEDRSQDPYHQTRRTPRHAAADRGREAEGQSKGRAGAQEEDRRRTPRGPGPRRGRQGPAQGQGRAEQGQVGAAQARPQHPPDCAPCPRRCPPSGITQAAAGTQAATRKVEVAAKQAVDNVAATLEKVADRVESMVAESPQSAAPGDRHPRGIHLRLSRHRLPRRARDEPCGVGAGAACAPCRSRRLRVAARCAATRRGDAARLHARDGREAGAGHRVTTSCGTAWPPACAARRSRPTTTRYEPAATRPIPPWRTRRRSSAATGPRQAARGTLVHLVERRAHPDLVSSSRKARRKTLRTPCRHVPWRTIPECIADDPPLGELAVSRAEIRQAVLAQRWRLATERLVEARYRFQRLNDADEINIQSLRRAARQVHDLERERGALGRQMEQFAD